MKKTGSKVLAATLVAGSIPTQVLATENVSEIENNENTLSIEKQASVTGKLELDINFAIPVVNTQSDMQVLLKGTDINETVLLSSNSGTTKSGVSYTIEKLKVDKKTIANNGEEISFIRVIFDKLPIGNYSLDLSANGYETVSISDLDITKYSKRIKIGTQEKEVAISYNEDGSVKEKEIYPALFLAGNINSDYKIDMEDYNIILNNIDKNNAEHDLNKDGKTDISDLSYLKGSIGSENKAPTDRSYIEDTDAIINPENIGVGIPSDAILPEGSDIKDLLKSDAPSVKIEREIAPSIDNPLSIKMNLTGTSIPGEDNTEQPTPVVYATNDAVTMEKVVIKAPNVEGSPETGNIVYIDEAGQSHTLPFGSENTKTLKSGDKEISIDLGSQVAVKEISIDVTGNRGNKNISEIAKIEFLNNVYKEIPKPVISIPTIKTLETSTNLHDERITISWEQQPNVTGYEIKYFKIDPKNGKAIGPVKILQTNKTNMNIKDKEIKPYDTYRVSIQSLNGDWESGYAEDLRDIEGDLGLTPEKEAELIPYELDGKPDNVDEKCNPIDSYYGTNGNEPNMGSVSDIQVIPIRIPEIPKNTKTKGGYRSINLTWPKHPQAIDFDIYYRKIGEEIPEVDKVWTKANDTQVSVKENDEIVMNPDKSKLIRANAFTLSGLDDLSSYELKMTGTNHLGTSKMSETYIATTTSLNPPKMPNYKLINIPKTNTVEGEIPTEHIVSVENSKHASVQVDSEFAAIDNNFDTNYIVNDWDAGASYSNYRGPIVEFDKSYSIDRISLAINQQEGSFASPNKSRIRGWDEDGNVKEYSSIITTEKDTNGKQYTTIKVTEPMNVKKVQVNLSVASNRKVSISELKFHEADNIEIDVANLFEDEFRVKLKENITQQNIDDLRKRVNTIDKVSLEYNPNREDILKELDVAESILNEANLSDNIIELDPKIIKRNDVVSLGMGNDWQSLGTVARPEGNNKLVIYMGTNRPSARIKVAFLQTYAHPGQALSKEIQLQPGRNEIEIPTLISEKVEKGGQVMVRLENVTDTTQVKIRVANGYDIPHLNVNNLINDKTKEDEIKEKIRVYIRNLKKYVANLPNIYPQTATDMDNVNNIYTYDPKTSVLNNTDIEGDRFTLTMPASEILRGIEQGLNGDENSQVERVYNALLAWEQHIQVAFAKKGVYESVDKAPSEEEYKKHKAPATRMNVKYQRSIIGANGYASGHHIGYSGFESTAGYMQGIPFKFDENQNVINPKEGKLYGALINHEMGHIMDIGARLYPETSNGLMGGMAGNMVSSNLPDTDKSFAGVYEKVTSHTLGLSTNRGIVGNMLYQPYLAYENNDTYKMIFVDNDTDPSNDSYYAKMNRAYRELTDEETKNADRDQLLMRVSSKIVGKDLTDFYISHGLVPNVDTLKYVSKFPKETKPIQYINKEARKNRLAGTATMASDTKVVASFGKDNDGKQISEKSYVNQTTVPINLNVTKDQDRILGYEILRNGKPCGFINPNEDGSVVYNDVVDNVNNRVFTYEVRAYDFDLNATEKVNLGTIKVRNDGSIEKSKLDISSNTIATEDYETYDKHSESSVKKQYNKLSLIKDNDKSNVYSGKVHAGACLEEGHDHENGTIKEDAYIVIDTNVTRSIAGLKYTAPTTTTKLFKNQKLSKSAIQNYEVQVSTDGKNWTKVKEGEFNLDANNPTETIYFDKEGSSGGNQLNVYNTRFIKLIAKGSQDISISELDLIAPPGDNIEIGVAEDNINYKNGIGILSEEFVYQPDNTSTPENERKSIPKGSIIITGEYRGNPAFNVPLVLNENEEHIADEYKGILMAEIPNNGNLEEISEGNWVYWVEPQFVNQFMQNKKVFAELYRTDTANALEGGQRMVSDTFRVDVEDELPEISLSGGQGRTLSESKKVVEIDTKTITKVVNNR